MNHITNLEMKQFKNLFSNGRRLANGTIIRSFSVLIVVSIVFLCFFTIPVMADGTVLTDGDIAFTRINVDDPDSFSFIVLTNIASSTTIYFSNEFWDGSSFNSDYYTILFTATSNIDAGDEVHVDVDTGLVTFTSGTSSATISSVGAYNAIGGNFLHAAGDSIMAFQGTMDSPTFIAAISCNTGVIGTSGNAWQVDSLSAGNTILPFGKTNGENGYLGLFPVGATQSEVDDCRYKTSATHTGDKATILAAIMNLSNWEFNNDNAFSTSSTPFTVTGGNAAPSISIADSTLAYTENGAATQIDAVGMVSDPDGDADWNGGTLEVQITGNAEAADEISISDTDGDGTAITVSGTNIFANGTDVGDLTASGGIVTGGTQLAISFDSDATNAIVQEVLQSLRYRSTSNNPGTSNRTITITASDASSASVSDTRTISVTAVNDEPTLSATGLNPTFTEDGSAVAVFSSASASTVESGQTLSGFTMTVTNVNNGSNERLNVDDTTIILTHGTSGVTASNSLSYSVSVVGTTATVNFSGGTLSTATFQTLINSVSYQNNSNIPNTSNRVVTITSLTDNGGIANSGDDTAYMSIASTVTVVANNDEPTLTATGSNPTFIEDGSAATVFSGASASTVESGQTLSGFTMTVTNVNNGSNERLNVDGTTIILTHGTSGTTATNSLSYSVSVVGTTATVNFSGGTLSTSTFQTLINSVSYQNNSNVPNTSNRVVTITSLTDSGSNAGPNDNINSSLAIASVISITDVNDEPTLSATGSNPTFTEDGSAVPVFSSTSASTVESGQTLSDFTMTVTNVNDGDSEILNLDGTAVILSDGTTGTTDTNSLSYSVSVVSTTATVSFSGGTLSIASFQTLINAVTYQNNSNTPNTSNRVVTITSLTDGGGTANGGDDTAYLSIASTVTVVANNEKPTLSSFTSVVETTTQNTEIEITLEELKAQGNDNDVDGTVDAFIVKALSTGTLNIGANSGTATAFNATTNKTIDASNNAYWTPSNDVIGFQNAFTTTVLDNNGAESTGAVQATVNVNDVTKPEISSITISGAPSDTDTSITYTVTFTESVVNVSTDDFSLTKTGSADGVIASVSASSGTNLNVTVNNITGTGTLRLDLNASTDIADVLANTPPVAYTLGAVHTVDRDNPTLSSSVPTDGATGFSASANIILTFNENIVFGTGNIQIIDLDDGSSTVTIDVALPGALASISNNNLILNPASNLKENTNYAVQIDATAIDDMNGNSYAGITDNTTLNFTVANVPAPPEVETTAASSITATAVTLNGTVNANNQSTVVSFEYGTSTSYGTTITADQNPVIGTTNTSVSKRITGLTPNSTYHYRVVGVNGSGITYGADHTFTTVAVPEINIKGNNTSIADGDTTADLTDYTDFGSIATGSAVIRTFVIENTGSADLTLDGTPKVEINGADKSYFTVTLEPTSPIATRGIEAFEVTFEPDEVRTYGAIVSIMNNDSDENPYTFTIQGMGTETLVSASEINIKGNNINISDGDTTADLTDYTDFGSVHTGRTVIRTFTIENTGSANLTLDGTPKVAISGTDESYFKVTLEPTSPIDEGTTKDFEITFEPDEVRTYGAIVSIMNNDSDENPYTFSIIGTGSLKSNSHNKKNDDTNNVQVKVDGDSQSNIAEVKTTKEGNATLTHVTLDQQRLEQQLSNQDNNRISLEVNNQSDGIQTELNGQMIKVMEDKKAVLEIKTENASYNIPIEQINIDAIGQQIGEQVALEDIQVNIEISKITNEAAKIIEDTENKESYTIIAPPIEFKITCTKGSTTIEVDKFNTYIERTILIPDGVDPYKITTGVIVNSDGTVNHVPTTIIKIDGKYYAKINSLTNSTYSVIWNEKGFDDASNHWAKDAINDMGSRLVIGGVGDNRFEPDRDITRAEYAKIVVNALGLMKPGTGKDLFNDVAESAWYYDAIYIANEYGLISGYGNGEFGPNDKITREQAMAILSRAMQITKINVDLGNDEVDQILGTFNDSKQVIIWAKKGVASCVHIGIVSGKGDKILAPQDKITRAEVAVIVRRLLQKSSLI